MTFFKQSLYIFVCLFCGILNAQQITIDDSFTEQQLIENNLVQGCVETSNIQSLINGQINGFQSFAYFERAGSNFPFENGIMLSTGRAISGGNTVNTAVLNEGQPNWSTDADLETALGITGTLNATSIEFDFVSVANQIQFNYILASEEYFGNFPCQYSDGFAFLIKEAGTADPYVNIAVIPGTTTPVNTTTIHDDIVGFCSASNEQYFEGYNLGDTNYNGRTTVMTATASIQPNVQYHIKLVIADQTDKNYDSAVFIEGNSFNATVDLGADIQTCAETVTLNGNIDNALATYSWYLDNVLIPGANQPTLDATQSGHYQVAIEIPLSGSTCLIEDDINLSLSSTQSAAAISDYTLCDDSTADGIETFDLSTKDPEVLNAVPASSYTITYHTTALDAQNGNNAISGTFQNTSNPQTIFIRIEDTLNGCLAFQNFDLVVNPLPLITQPSMLVTCDDATADGYTTIDLTQKNNEITNGNLDLAVSYHYNQTDATNGMNAIPQPYVNTNPTETIYVHVSDINTGCAVTTTLDIEVLNNPVINTENHYIEACDTDHDGLATFDLTSITDDVLEGLTGVNVSFHETQEDADNGTNPIINPTNYNNTTLEQQTLYIRVEDANTGCASTTPIEIHTNLLLTATHTQNFTICDEANDGVEEFDLNYITNFIIYDIEDVMNYDVDIDFYLTENDRDNGINALDPSIPFQPTETPQILYITLTSPECQEVDEIELTIVPIVEFDPIDDQTICDLDQDGFTSIDLSAYNLLVTQGQADFSVSYFASETDANDNVNALPSFYTNTSNPQTIFTRITYGLTGCADVNSFTIEVLPAPLSNTPSDIIICDDDQDGVSIVNLDAKISELVSDTTDRNITFHQSFNAAETASNAIVNTSAYAAQTAPIFVRIENTLTGCHSVENFEIIVNTLPVFTAISNYKICENASDDIADFIFSTKDAEILNGQSGKEVLYFETALDAENNANAIDKTTAYQNTSNPQTIFVRVQNLTDFDCYSTTSFTIEVGTNPTFNEPSDWFVCDDISNDGSETFDLNVKVQEISNGITDNLDISFYTSLANAENQINALPLNYTNTTNPQQIFAVIDNGTICNSITSFELNIIQVPEANLAPPLAMCDTDYDGIVTFDLTQSEFDILDVRQDDITVTYFETISDLETDSNPIQNPDSYTNLSNPQTVYVKITNTISNCYAIIPLELIVNLPPEINDFQTFEICENTSNSFDLATIDAVIVNDNTGLTITYYSTLNDAETMTNQLGNSYTYQSTNDLIFARVSNNSTSCFTTYGFNLVVNPLPEANIPEDLQACDDASNDGLAAFNLVTNNAAILGTQSASNFAITFHQSLVDAETFTNPLPEDYTGQDQQVIFVRVENLTTGCFNTTQFTLIVNAHPNIPTPLLMCDDDYDGLTTFDLTTVESDLFSAANPDNTISYFETLEDLEADTNGIAAPNAYQNTSNPQTVFIKIYNTVADCYTHVPLELHTNLPPSINPMTSYPACESATNMVDLLEINSTLLEQTANVQVVYYATESDAQNQSNPLDTNYNYQTTQDTLFARIEFTTTHCFYIQEFTLQINPLPVANQPAHLEVCDNDFDGFFTFDLTQQNSQILSGQNPNQFTISYYLDAILAEEGVDSLGDTYEAMTDEILYARIENSTTGCYSITQFSTIIHPKPLVAIDDQVICLDNLPLLVSANTNNPGDSYIWSTNETTPEIEITDIGTYFVTVTSPMGCETTSVFTVSESEAATIEITESVDFSDPNNIIVTISGIGNYLYQLDDEAPQESSTFENVSLGYHTITIIDLNGCAEVSKEIVVIDAPKFFTPNNDSYFDTWHITGVETLTGTIVYIYDRYGKLLKTLDSDDKGWDGRYNGHLMPANDYWFVADVRKDNIAFQVKGHFSLRL